MYHVTVTYNSHVGPMKSINLSSSTLEGLETKVARLVACRDILLDGFFKDKDAILAFLRETIDGDDWWEVEELAAFLCPTNMPLLLGTVYQTYPDNNLFSPDNPSYLAAMEGLSKYLLI